MNQKLVNYVNNMTYIRNNYIPTCDLAVPVDRVSQQRDHFFTHAVASRSTFVMTETELAAALTQQEQERAKFEEAMKKRKTTLNIYIL